MTDHACSIDDEIVDDDDECLDNNIAEVVMNHIVTKNQK